MKVSLVGKKNKCAIFELPITSSDLLTSKCEEGDSLRKEKVKAF